MHFTFDHVVHYMNEPKQAIPFLKEQGIHAVMGGKHPDLGSYNILSYFDLSYIEFFGVEDKEAFTKINHLPHTLMQSIINDDFAEGFSRLVVSTNDIKRAAEHFKAEGLTVNGPMKRARKRPDGSEVTWQLLYVGTDDATLEMPYIIQWDEAEEERKDELTSKGIIAPHEEDYLLKEVLLAVHDVDETVRKWMRLLKLEELGESFVDDALQARCRKLSLPGGNLQFFSPIDEGIVSSVLATRGEKIFQVNLSGGKEKGLFELANGRYEKK